MDNCDKFIFWGSAGHAKVLSEIVMSKNMEIIAVFDNQHVKSVFPGVPIFYGEEGFRNWLSGFKSMMKVAGIAAIGNSGLDRIHIHNLFRKSGVHVPILVHSSSFVSKYVKIGDGTQVLAMSVISSDVLIGSSCIINSGAVVEHECVVGDGVHVAPNATICGCVNVKKNAFIGAGSVILPRLNIGEGAIVGAGAVVTRDVPDSIIVRGNPAKPFNRLHRVCKNA